MTKPSSDARDRRPGEPADRASGDAPAEELKARALRFVRSARVVRADDEGEPTNEAGAAEGDGGSPEAWRGGRAPIAPQRPGATPTRPISATPGPVLVGAEPSDAVADPSDPSSHVRLVVDDSSLINNALARRLMGVADAPTAGSDADESGSDQSGSDQSGSDEAEPNGREPAADAGSAFEKALSAAAAARESYEASSEEPAAAFDAEGEATPLDAAAIDAYADAGAPEPRVDAAAAAVAAAAAEIDARGAVVDLGDAGEIAADPEPPAAAEAEPAAAQALEHAPPREAPEFAQPLVADPLIPDPRVEVAEPQNIETPDAAPDDADAPRDAADAAQTAPEPSIDTMHYQGAPAANGHAPDEPIPSEAEIVAPAPDQADAADALAEPDAPVEAAPPHEAYVEGDAPAPDHATAVAESEIEPEILAVAEDEAPFDPELAQDFGEAEESALAAARAAAEERRRRDEEAERKRFIEENSVGALFRGARATAGKHDLKQVERELRIKAHHLEAIEAVDVDRLPDEAYLGGFVRAYARYLGKSLGMTPEEAYEKFTDELESKLGPEEVKRRENARAEAAMRSAGLSGAPIKRPSFKRPVKGEGPRAAPTRASRIAPARGAARAAPPPEEPSDDVAATGAGLADKARKDHVERMKAEEAERAKAAAATRKQREEAAARALARAKRAAAVRDEAEAAAAQLRPPSAGFGQGLASTAILVLGLALGGGLLYWGYTLFQDAQRVTATVEGDKPLTVIERRDTLRVDGGAARPDESALDLTVDGPLGARLDERSETPIAAVDPSEVGVYRAPANGAGAEAASPDANLGATAGANAAPEANAGVDSAPPSANDAAIDAPPSAADPALEPEAAAPNVEEGEALAAAAAAALGDAPAAPRFALRSTQDTWVRIRNSAGDVLFSGLMRAGEMRALPPEQGPFEVRLGNASGAAVVVGDQAYGPLDRDGVVATVFLSHETAADTYAPWPQVTEALTSE